MKAHQVIAWYGDAGAPTEAMLVVPYRLRKRYQATARIGAYSPGGPPAIEFLTVTDKRTGASVVVRDGRATIAIGENSKPEAVALLWRHAQAIIDRARVPIGRPAGLTTIANDEQLRAPIREMRRAVTRVTQGTVAARSGFTVKEIRGYLRVTRRTWQEFLDTF